MGHDMIGLDTFGTILAWDAGRSRTPDYSVGSPAATRSDAAPFLSDASFGLTIDGACTTLRIQCLAKAVRLFNRATTS